MTIFDKFRNCITEPRCRDCEGIPGVCEEEHQSVSIPKALALDVLNELKEQETVTEYVMDEYQPTCKACGFRPFAGYIPSLEWMRERGFKYCPHCGQAVKWNADGA